MIDENNSYNRIGYNEPIPKTPNIYMFGKNFVKKSSKKNILKIGGIFCGTYIIDVDFDLNNQ